MAYLKISNEAFKRGAELIEFREFKPTKKLKEQKEEEIDNYIPFGEMDEDEFEEYLKYFYYKMVLKCPYCDGFIRNSAHFKKHNISKEEFTNLYGGYSPLDIAANKILSWYSPNLNKWAIQQPGEPSRYTTYTTENQKLYNNKLYQKYKEDGTNPIYGDTYLRPEAIRKHLRYSTTVSIYPWGNRAGWICLDVDTQEDAFEDTKRIVNTMVKHGINRNNIFVSFSGGKGYHIELFFQYAMTYKQIEFFGEKICSLTGADIKKKNNTNQIEIRPTSEMGIKLPLGKNQRTGKVCKILDADFNEIKFQYQEILYFLNINKVDNQIISDILNLTDQPEEIKTNKSEEKIKEDLVLTLDTDDDEEYYQYKLLPSLESRIKAIENKFDNGLKAVGTRNKWLLQIAIWLRDIQGVDQDEAEEILIQWTLRNLDYIKKENDAIRNAKDVVKTVFKDDGTTYSLEKGLKPKILTFYPEEIKFIKRVQMQAKKELKAKTNAPSKLYFTFLCLSKYFKNDRGIFFVSRKDLEIYSGLSNRTIIRWINWLIHIKGYIILVKQGNSFQHLANEYSISPISINSINGKLINIEINNLNIIELYEQLITT